MKNLLFGDTHLGIYSDSDAWLEIVFNFYKHITKYCYNNKINRIIIGGDFFDNRKSLNTKTQHMAHRIAKVLNVVKNLHTYIIVGNHDCYYKNRIQPNTLELFKQYNHITIVDEITKLDDILLVPWGEVPKDTQGAKYCFGHFAINGFHMNDSYRCKNGLDEITFKDFDRVFSSHFHTPSSNHNITYLGAPYGQTFHDANGVRGFHIFEDGKLTFIEYENAPKFFKYNTANPCAREDIEGNIVKIIFDKDYGTTKNQEKIDNVLEFNPFLYSVSFAKMETDDPESITEEDIEMDSREKIIDQYIESQQFPTNINISILKSMFRKIMKETGESRSRIRTSNGTKIECISVGFQNFLSFGSQWQEIPLHNGVNFVTGFDKDKGKSNGAGKSSFLETIPFALFGKTAREIKQSQIINWKNKKNCHVVFKFKINEDVYEISRKIKPNKLEVYKNGELLDQDAHKIDYQNMFEEIFGMDVKMFMSLVHSNLNNSANILNMKKDEKRKFLERMFDLDIYSDMNKSCNDKIRDIEQKKYKMDMNISSYNDKIDSCKKMKTKFYQEIESKKLSIEDVDDIKKQLDKLKEDFPNIDNELNKVNYKLSGLEEDKNEIQIEHEKFLIRLEEKTLNIKNELSRINEAEEQKKENAKIQAKIDAIVEKSGNVDDINNKIEELEIEKEEKSVCSGKSNDSAMKLYKEIAELKGKLKAEDESIQLLANGKCPTCGQDTKDPVTHKKKDIASLRRKITNREKKYKTYADDTKKYQEEVTTLSNKIKILHKTKDTLNKLSNQIKNLDDIGDREFYNRQLKEVTIEKKDVIDVFLKKQEEIVNESISLKNKANELSTNQDRIREIEQKYEVYKTKSEEIEKHINSLESLIKEQDESIDKIKDDIKESNENIKKINNIKDYIDSIKIILKDENIKQFTIKKIMPFINKQANYYLSEVNYGFYVKIDKWLDVDIKGPGIRNATYKSLSGGERRGIDIAVQLALLDVARTQAGLFPDILIFDELLDSSIDSNGINELMKIVKSKQKEFGGKVFVITHRPEIDSEMADNQYEVVKENGYSKVNI